MGKSIIAPDDAFASTTTRTSRPGTSQQGAPYTPDSLPFVREDSRALYSFRQHQVALLFFF